MKKFLHSVSNTLFKGQIARERLFLVTLITLLVVIWFRKGLIIGSGESALPFYNTAKLLEILGSNWTNVPLGSGGSIGFPSLPLFAVVTFFQQLNVPSFIIQAVMYWFIFVVGVLSIHKIASSFEGSTSLSRLSSSLFYIFNPIVHISILHRFQYTIIFFYSFLPLAFYIYLKGLKARKFIYLLALSLVSLIFSFAFVGLSFLELFFAILACLSIFSFLKTFKQRDFFPLFYFLAFIVIFTLVHSWWIAPLFSSLFVDLGTTGSVKYFNSSDNVETFKLISIQIESVSNIFRLFKPNDYPVDESSWAWIYGTIPFIILSFFSIIAFTVGIFKEKKDFLYKFLLLIALIGIFLSKGSLPPFGEITLFLFERFTLLHPFRNPFEKIGVLLPFAMAIPIGFGITIIVNKLTQKIKIPKKTSAFLILTLFFPVFMFPILTGLAFTGGPPPSNNMEIGQYVKVPEYYKETREWLDKQKGPFRALVLPIDGEGMTYKWEYGFSGVELSNNIFNQPMISFSSSQAFLPEMVDSIKNTLLNYPEKIWVLCRLLNVKYIIVRDDIDHIARGTESPQTDLRLINQYMSKHFSLAAEFGKLKIFELNPSEYYQRIYTATTPTYLHDPVRSDIDLVAFSAPQQNEMFISLNEKLKNPAEDPFVSLVKGIIIRGSRIENVTTDQANAIERLPYVSVFRDTPFYALVRLKEEIEIQNQTPDTALAFRATLLGKRLSEINYSPNDKEAINEFYEKVKDIANELRNSQSPDRAIVEVIVNQREALKGVKDKTVHKELISEVESYVDQLLIDIEVRSVFPTKNKLIHRFNIAKDSKYEILIAKENWNYYFEDNGILEFDLDGNTIKLDSSQLGNNPDTFSLGTYTLNRGFHEVSIPEPKSLNLLAENLPEELVLNSQDKQPVTKVVPLKGLNNTYSYKLSFDYLEEKGNVPVIALHSDVDSVDKKGEKIPRFAIGLIRDNYNFGWKQYAGHFSPFLPAQKHHLSFKVLPFGDCKAVTARPYRRYCEDNEFNQKVLRDSSYRIRNLKVEKVFQNPVVLKEVENTVQAGQLPKIEFTEITPARYKVNITNAQNPFFLVLSTSFDPRWQAYFTNNQPKSLLEVISESEGGDPISSQAHIEVNGYANGWYVDKVGNYEMYLEYSPERVFIIGNKFAILVISISSLILLIYLYREIKIASRS